jgi:hypothetical protein
VSRTPETSRIRITGDHFSLDNVRVGIYRNDNGAAVWEQTVEAFQGGGIGASILVDTGVLDCSGLPPGASSNNFAAHAQAKDLLSGFLSNSVSVVTGCSVI